MTRVGEPAAAGSGRVAALAQRAAVALCLALFAAIGTPPARAEEHFFPGLKFTIRLPDGWRLATIGRLEAAEDDGVFHSEFQVEHVVRAPWTPLASFTKPDAEAYLVPWIGLSALGRGPPESPDIARSVLEGRLVQKSRAVLDPEILSKPRVFPFGATRVFFADMDYGVVDPDGREYGIYSQLYVVELKEALLLVEIETGIGDLKSHEEISGVLGWLRIF